MRNNDEIITIIKSAMKEQDMSLSELARRVELLNLLYHVI